MNIQRVDPYLVRWSADGVIALATESAGLQFLFIDTKELLESRLRWKRARSIPSINGRVIDMQWSPTLLSSDAGCLLACVIHSGDVLVLEAANEEVTIVDHFVGTYSAACWLGETLVLGDEEGNLYGFQHSAEQWVTRIPLREGVGIGGHREKITALAAFKGQIAAATVQNQCWLTSDHINWKQVIEKSRFRIESIAFNNQGLIVLKSGTLQLYNGVDPVNSVRLDSYLGGHIVAYANKCSIIHSNGQVFESTKSGIPHIKGAVSGACVHPTLPMAIVVVSADSLPSQGWKYPILSWESVNLAVFPLFTDLVVPRRIDAAASASWLMIMMLKEKQQQQQQQKSFNSLPAIPSSKASISISNLEMELRTLFLSTSFDALRIQWYTEETSRNSVEQTIRNSIASVLQNVTPQTSVDRLIASFYLGFQYGGFKVEGDGISEEFPEAGDSGAESLEFNHSKLATSAMTLTSSNGRVWKRCALTLLPLLTLETKVSSEGMFIAYNKLPSLLIQGQSNASSPIADALMRAANFCIFTGTNWENISCI